MNKIEQILLLAVDYCVSSSNECWPCTLCKASTHPSFAATAKYHEATNWIWNEFSVFFFRYGWNKAIHFLPFSFVLFSSLQQISSVQTKRTHIQNTQKGQTDKRRYPSEEGSNGISGGIESSGRMDWYLWFWKCLAKISHFASITNPFLFFIWNVECVIELLYCWLGKHYVWCYQIVVPCNVKQSNLVNQKRYILFNSITTQTINRSNLILGDFVFVSVG